jgi:hypothetical protein
MKGARPLLATSEVTLVLSQKQLPLYHSPQNNQYHNFSGTHFLIFLYTFMTEVWHLITIVEFLLKYFA